jgi:UDP-glucose 4-epimerase
MNTVLITGVAGLLGSRMAEWISETQPETKIVGIDNLSGGYEFNIPSDIDFYNSSMYAPSELHNIFRIHSPNIVYHFAAYAAEGLSPFIRSYNYINNVIATSNMVNCCIEYEVDRLVFTSTMAVYGDQISPFEESMTPQPIDPYGVAKYACEMDIQIAGEQHGLDWCIIRPHNVYGRNQNISDSYRNVLGIWMYKHLHGEPLSIYGDGLQKRAFSYIDDSLEPLWNSAILPEASRQIINLGGINEYTIKESAETLIDVMGGGSIEYMQKRHEVKNAWATHDKSVDILKFQHKTDLHDGLSKMWHWASNLQEIPPRLVWPKYELHRGLYPFWEQKNLMKDGNYRLLGGGPKVISTGL